MTQTTYSKETLELLEDVVDETEAKEFIETHGEQAFIDHYETVVGLFDHYEIEAIDAFIETFSIEDIDHFQDAYYGEYESGAEFAEQFANDIGYINRDLPSWIEIDWQESWENLSYDFLWENGYIFCANF
tara:strand:- start:1001 stop:1390 length:390 start_codon:yes stop_codon:yes gene_type:complete